MWRKLAASVGNIHSISVMLWSVARHPQARRSAVSPTSVIWTPHQKWQGGMEVSPRLFCRVRLSGRHQNSSLHRSLGLSPYLGRFALGDRLDSSMSASLDFCPTPSIE